MFPAALDRPRGNPLREGNPFGKKKEGREVRERKKIYTKVHGKSSKLQLDMLNRSTLNSFHQIEEHKQKMLRKIEADKERGTNDMRLSDAFFITKYGSKFNVDSKLKHY